MGVLSGLEMACWDIIGKAAGKPVYELLGGKVHERLRSYTYLYPPGDAHVYPDAQSRNVYNDPDLAAEIALHWVEQGFSAVKFDPGGPYTVFDGHQPSLEDLERSELFCKRIREAVGMRADLLFGTHGQFTTSGAKRMARRIEAYDRCGLKSRCRQRCPIRWHKWRGQRPFPSRRASGFARSTSLHGF